MNAQRYALVKTLFIEAIQRSGEERDAYLGEACADDIELRHEVESLLAHHSEETILHDTQAGEDTTEAFVGTKGRPASPQFGRRIRRLTSGVPQNSPLRRLFVLAVVGLLLAGVGWWTYRSIHQALRSVRGDSLRAVLDANVMALELWIESREAEAKACAEDAHLQAAVSSLVEFAREGSPSPDALRQSAARQQLHDMVQPYVDEQDSAGYFVVDRTGFILSTTNDAIIGARLNARGMALMTPVFEGTVVYSRPYPPGSLVNTTHSLGVDRPMCWVDVAVKNSDGDYIASIGFAKFADEHFSEILGVGYMGATGETYALDADGLMLSESRFNKQLCDIGLIENQATLRSMVTVQVRDPGVDLTRGKDPEMEVAARPLTKIAALAVASRDKDDPALQQGLLLDAYRDYRGVPVIGAWRWLPRYEMGVVTEMDVDEAYQPLWYLLTSYGVLFGLLAMTATAATVSAFSADNWRRRVRVAEELGPYRLGKKLGEGGMGTVYLAQHAMLKRPAAIKLLKDDQVGPQAMLRFEREVQIASRLTHPNTIEIYDFGRTQSGVFYYAMEYVDGLTLHDLVARGGPVSPERVVFILCQVCGSLAEAHSQNLIHRDIKPQNVMLCQRGGQFDFVKVLDFGLAKDLNPAGTDHVTKTMQVGGTPLYMSPERFIDPRNVDHRSDIYAIGAVGYYLLHGRSHLEADDRLETTSAVAEPDAPGLSQRGDSSALDEIVAACLEQSPDDRPQSVDDLSQQLRAVALTSTWTASEARAWWQANVLPEQR